MISWPAKPPEMFCAARQERGVLGIGIDLTIE